MDSNSILDKLAVREVKTQSDYLADKIKGMITSGDISDGFKFPNENDFCKQLNVSRATLREAYKILDTQGFIQRTKQGTVVKNRQEIAKEGNFSASMELAREQEIIEFVCALEPEAVYLATEKASPNQLIKLGELMMECEECNGNSKKLIEANYRFHAFIREMANNNLITSALKAYYDLFNHQVIEGIYSMSSDTEEFQEESLEAHRAIYAAIKGGDAELAKKLAYNHLRSSVEFQILQNK